MSIFSETLKMLRNRRDMSQEKLAELLSVSTAHIKRLETDYVVPDQNLLCEIAELFDVTVSYLVGMVSHEIMVDEPGYLGSRRGYISVPVVSGYNIRNSICRESDIIDRIILPKPDNSYEDYIAVKASGNCGISRFSKDDVAIIRKTTALSDGDIIAFCRKDSDVLFLKYRRQGQRISLYGDNDSLEITYLAGEPDNYILGKVIGVQTMF